MLERWYFQMRWECVKQWCVWKKHFNPMSYYFLLSDIFMENNWKCLSRGVFYPLMYSLFRQVSHTRGKELTHNCSGEGHSISWLLRGNRDSSGKLCQTRWQTRPDNLCPRMVRNTRRSLRDPQGLPQSTPQGIANTILYREWHIIKTYTKR